MKKLVSLLLCLVLVFSMTACGNGNSNTPTPTPTPEVKVDVVEEAAMAYFANFADDRNIISAAKLFEKMDANEPMFILDIRGAEDYAKEHLKGAVNVPYGTGIADALVNIPNDVNVYVNCYSGQTSSQTTALLRAAGKYAVNIGGGYSGISKAEGYDGHQETTVNALPTDTYEVAPEIVEAVRKYYTDALGGQYRNFHFPVADVLALVEAGSTAYTILDVRAAADYEKGHIAGAINIPFGKNMQESFSAIPTDKPVIITCYSGQTASQVLGVLRLLGFEAYNMPGGMNNGWKENPVVQ